MVTLEKWILRTLMLAVIAVALAAVYGSLNDIKRYVRIKRMLLLWHADDRRPHAEPT